MRVIIYLLSMGKRIEIFSNVPSGVHKYVIVPVGVYFHKSLKDLKRGDSVYFNEGWRMVKMEYVGSCILKVNSPIFVFMMRSLYGDGMTIRGLFAHWSAVCINEGYGKNGFSRDEVMLIEVAD